MTITSSSSLRAVERRSFGPSGRSSTVARFRHFKTFFGMIPPLRPGSMAEACDRGIGSLAVKLLKKSGARWLDRICGGALLTLAASLAFYRRAGT